MPWLSNLRLHAAGNGDAAKSYHLKICFVIQKRISSFASLVFALTKSTAKIIKQLACN
jgi:hypothetical protein